MYMNTSCATCREFRMRRVGSERNPERQPANINNASVIFLVLRLSSNPSSVPTMADANIHEVNFQW